MLDNTRRRSACVLIGLTHVVLQLQILPRLLCFRFYLELVYIFHAAEYAAVAGEDGGGGASSHRELSVEGARDLILFGRPCICCSNRCLLNDVVVGRVCRRLV